MERKDIQMLGFEIVAYAGEATSTLMQALKEYVEGNYSEANKLYEQSRETIVEAHNVQTKMLQAEANDEEIPYSFTMVHGQDHLMSAVLLRDVIEILLKSKKD